MTIVNFRAASSTTYVTSTTTNVTIPVSAVAGDRLVMYVMHRAALTVPTGWTLLRTIGPESASNQMLSVLTREAQAGDAGQTVTLTQASSQRFAAHIQAFWCDDPIEVEAHDGTFANTYPLALPSLTATKNGSKACVASSYNRSLISGDTTIFPPTGYALTTPASVADNRLGAAYATLASGDEIDGQFALYSTYSGSTLVFSMILSPVSSVRNLFISSTQITDLQFGSTPINALYLGSTLIWER